MGKFPVDILQHFKNNLSPKNKIKINSYIDFYWSDISN